MNINDIITESAVGDLVKQLPTLSKHNYNTIDVLMRKIAHKHRITGKALHDLFVRKYKKTPDSWASKLDEVDEGTEDIQEQIDNFVAWACGKLHIKNIPSIELSQDTQEAQEGHHTGRHVMGEDSIWVYVKNRNLVDIMRTVFHELVHIRQGELNMIKPGSSYPGSPIEAMADMMAGKYIKIYGKMHHEIFQ